MNDQGSSGPAPACERQDERNVGYDRNPDWIIEDVYFCSKCLEYRRVDVMRRVPKNDGGNWLTRLR